jgi:septum formation protein
MNLFPIEGVDIVLASGSPRRRALLAGLGWRFEAAAPEADESAVPGETPEALCVRLAVTKAESVAKRRADALVIGADTLVLADGEVLGKPRGREESLRMLRRLQGRVHEVLTGIGLFWKGRSASGLERTAVRFRAFGEETARAYAATGEGMDKAGAYAIQGRGALLVSSIEGDYFNVVGLPLCRLGKMIEEIMSPGRVRA